jgi:hypothetical protein
MEQKIKSPFFERLEQVMKQYGIDNVSQLAESLGYSASEKLNRLKDPEKKPSIDIIVDIIEKWPEIDTNWLLTGHGQKVAGMLTYGVEPKKDQTYLNEYIQSIKQHNLFLQDLLKTNLAGLSTQQQVLQAEIQAIHQWDAQTVAKGNADKEKDALHHIHKLSADNLKRLRKKNIHVDKDR